MDSYEKKLQAQIDVSKEAFSRIKGGYGFTRSSDFVEGLELAMQIYLEGRNNIPEQVKENHKKVHADDLTY